MTTFDDVELVHIMRAKTLDCIHRGRLAVVDDTGAVILSWGDLQSRAFLRSSAKPFQATMIIESGAQRRYDFSTDELAIMAGSHAAEDHHMEVLARIMAKIALPSEALLCGADLPLDEQYRKTYLAQGGQANVLRHNCSGKHLGMLASCLVQGWQLSHYNRPEHPLQRAILQIMSDASDLLTSQIEVATDGCTVPTFALPLHNAALAFARLGVAVRDKPYSPLGIVGHAMRAFPEVFSGTRQLDNVLIRASGRQLVSKGGAEGFWGVAIPERGWGLALKMSDGSPRAIAFVLSSVLQKLGVLSAQEARLLEEQFSPIIKANDGTAAGYMKFVPV